MRPHQITDTKDELLQEDERHCSIKNFRTGAIPNDLQDCRAISYGGIPTIEMAYKLEETDMNYDNYDEYLSELHYQQDEYMRNAVSDRNLEIPFAESDLPGYNTTRNSGALNLRYNENRGTTDYMPAHPEMMIGQDPFAGQDTGLKLAEMKRFTAQRAEDATVRMGDNSAEQIPEQPWADPEISYAKKDMFRWTSKVKNIWQWPSFENFQTSHKTKGNISGQKMTNHNCGKQCQDEEIYNDTTHDTKGKVKHTQIGYNYDLGKYQDQTINFNEEEMGQVRSTKEKENFQINRNDVTFEGQNIGFSHSNENKIFKTKLLDAMKAAISQQEISGKMGNSIKGNKVKAGKEFMNRSVIRDILESQKRKKETMITNRSGLSQNRDAGYLQRETYKDLKKTLQIKNNMIRGSRNDKDLNYIQRDIQNTMKLNQETKAKIGYSGLKNNVDRQAIMKDIQTTHKTGCSTENKCFSGQTGKSQEKSILTSTDTTQPFHDHPINHTRSSKLLTNNPKGLKEFVSITGDVLDTNISDTARLEGNRNR